jgi:peroxiredoxin
LAPRTLLALLLASTTLVALLPSASAGDPFVDLDLVRPPQRRLAPDFTVPRLGSGSISLKELRGSVVFLNFWATWCPPCKEEMPSMERLYRRHKDHGFVIVAISIDSGNAEGVAAFVKKLGLTFPIGLDPKLEVANRFTVRALPSSFLIDRDGNTVAVALGPRAWDGTTAHAVVESLLR